MNETTVPQTVLFPDLFEKPLIATFDQPNASSDGGAILLTAAEARYGLIDGFARCLIDERQPGKVRHTLADLLAQRIFGLACGYPDANDAARLADDPIHKLLLGRDPGEEAGHKEGSAVEIQSACRQEHCQVSACLMPWWFASRFEREQLEITDNTGWLRAVAVMALALPMRKATRR